MLKLSVSKTTCLVVLSVLGAGITLSFLLFVILPWQSKTVSLIGVGLTVLLVFYLFNVLGRLAKIQKQSDEQSAELERINKELRKEISVRKKAQDESIDACEKLRKAQKDFLELERMAIIGRIARGLAHEIKNPLAVIVQGIDFLSKSQIADNKDFPVMIEHIRNAVNRADRIMQGLADFSKISKMDMKPDDINKVIENTTASIKTHLENNHITLIEDLEDGLPLINMDKSRIGQVLVSLMLNAIQAMPEGGRLEVSTFIEEKGKRNQVFVQIQDNGSGIPEEIFPKIFEPYFTTRQKSGGVGLGLTVVKNIVEMHGGEIEIRNRQKDHGVTVLMAFKAAAV